MKDGFLKAAALSPALRVADCAYNTRQILTELRAAAARGVKLVSGGTDNHLLLIDLTDEDCTGKELEHRLDEVHITANKNAIPDDPQSPFITSGLRIGTPAVTSRGFKEPEMEKIAAFIADILGDYDKHKERVTAEVIALCEKFPIYAN